MAEAMKGVRLAHDKVAGELKKLQNGLKHTKPVSEFEKEIAARKAANTENNELKRELKHQREELEDASRECWQLKCELNAIRGVAPAPPPVASGEHYVRRNGSARVPLEDFNRTH